MGFSRTSFAHRAATAHLVLIAAFVRDDRLVWRVGPLSCSDWLPRAAHQVWLAISLTSTTMWHDLHMVTGLAAPSSDICRGFDCWQLGSLPFSRCKPRLNAEAWLNFRDSPQHRTWAAAVVWALRRCPRDCVWWHGYSHLVQKRGATGDGNLVAIQSSPPQLASTTRPRRAAGQRTNSVQMRLPAAPPATLSASTGSIEKPPLTKSTPAEFRPPDL